MAGEHPWLGRKRGCRRGMQLARDLDQCTAFPLPVPLAVFRVLSPLAVL